jgi:hypothetical protein
VLGLGGNLEDQMSLYISKHCTENNEHLKENKAIRALGDDNNANGDETIMKEMRKPMISEGTRGASDMKQFCVAMSKVSSTKVCWGHL